MKTSKKIRKFKIVSLVGIILLLMVGCEETTVTTKVAPDGSCQRTITIKSDSDSLSKDSFPIPLDDSWSFTKRKEEKKEEKKGEKKEVTKEKKKSTRINTVEKSVSSTTAESLNKEKNHIYIAKKSFDRVEDLNKEFFQTPKGTKNVKRFAKLEKRFRWFYTFLTYREVCGKLNPFNRIPLKEYFSEEEMEIVTLSLFHDDEAEEKYSKEKLAEIEDKFEEWFARNVFEEVFLALLQAAGKAEVPGLTPETFNAQKEALFEVFKKKTDIFDDLSLDLVFKTCEEVFQKEDLIKLREQGKDAFREIEAKFAAWDDIDIFSGFTNKVIMPGLIIETNAKTVSGSTAIWDVDIGKYLLMEYEMWVESRLVNWWAVGIAAFLLILIIAALFIGTLRRRVQNSR